MQGFVRYRGGARSAPSSGRGREAEQRAKRRGGAYIPAVVIVVSDGVGGVGGVEAKKSIAVALCAGNAARAWRRNEKRMHR